MKTTRCPNCSRAATPEELKADGCCDKCSTGRSSVPPVLDPELAHDRIEAKLDDDDFDADRREYRDPRSRDKLFNIGDVLRMNLMR